MFIFGSFPFESIKLSVLRGSCEQVWCFVITLEGDHRFELGGPKAITIIPLTKLQVSMPSAEHLNDARQQSKLDA